MAKESAKRKRVLRKSPTVREQAQSKAVEKTDKRRLHRATTSAKRPLRAAVGFGKREYYLPLPDNKFGRFLNKKRYFIPSYIRNSFKELRGVTWPSRKETTQLTIAVFVFAIVFGVIITITDYGLDKVFKRILLR